MKDQMTDYGAALYDEYHIIRVNYLPLGLAPHVQDPRLSDDEVETIELDTSSSEDSSSVGASNIVVMGKSNQKI